jgi:transglutaminase-like putative cysteine protease
MLIRLGYDIQFDIPYSVPIVALLHVHPSRVHDLLQPDALETEPQLDVRTYIDGFGNKCARFVAPPGRLRLSMTTTIRDTDRLSNIAAELFGNIPPGWGRVQAICNWVHNKVAFDYSQARPTKTALDVFTERVGVCRDFQHLAITFCRALNIPARYATGYLGDIGVPLRLPMDFSAWFEVYLDDRWWTFDARNNQPRIGRVLMATGRDASDVAITTSFGQAILRYFFVLTDELNPEPSEAPTVLESQV